MKTTPERNLNPLAVLASSADTGDATHQPRTTQSASALSESERFCLLARKELRRWKRKIVGPKSTDANEPVARSASSNSAPGVDTIHRKAFLREMKAFVRQMENHNSIRPPA